VLWAFFAMFGFYAIGFFFFLTRIPERWFPGAFDVLLHSHQLWHVFVFLAGASWLEGMLFYLRCGHCLQYQN
jgi:adiponectin receptor